MAEDSAYPEANLRRPTAWWQAPRVAAAVAAVVAALILALAWAGWRWSVAEDRLELLQAQAAAGFLLPPSSEQTLRLDPMTVTSVSVGKSDQPARLDVHIAARSNRFHLFRVAIVRDDGTAIAHFDRLARDSNGELRFALNSSVLPAGGYEIRVSGFTWRGDTVPVWRLRLTLVAR
jgi:hypothetical protein